MAEPEPSKPGLQISFGHLHITATVALVASVIGGFYTSVEWVTRVGETVKRDEAAIAQLSRQNERAVEELLRQIDGLKGVIATANERDNQQNDAVMQRIFDLQQLLASMQQNYKSVQTLETRYDQAFATYQPQRKRRH